MAKELMEIGGFITEGAEIVNHDASLSGNGTVDSPLGVSEIVLADNIPNDATSFTLSEKPTNFERIRIYSTKGPIIEIQPNDNYLTWSCTWIDSSSNNMIHRVYQVSSSNGLSWTGGRVYGYHMNGSSTITGDYGSSNWYLETKKIVGINRIANN